jgi:hypothetical protein
MIKFLRNGYIRLHLFAMFAPAEIPEWFTGIKPAYEGPAYPDKDALTRDDLKIVNAWLGDPIFDLPEHLKWWESKFEAWQEAQSDYRKDCWIARYFQWRWWYAEQMLEHRP